MVKHAEYLEERQYGKNVTQLIQTNPNPSSAIFVLYSLCKQESSFKNECGKLQDSFNTVFSLI